MYRVQARRRPTSGEVGMARMVGHAVRGEASAQALPWTRGCGGPHTGTCPLPALRATGQGQPWQARRGSMRIGEGGRRGSVMPPGLSRRRLLQGATATAGLLTLG